MDGRTAKARAARKLMSLLKDNKAPFGREELNEI